MSKLTHKSLLSFALWVFFAGASIGAGMILYILIGYDNPKAQQFKFLNGGLLPLLLGFITAYLSDRKYKEIRGHLTTN